MVSCRVRTVIQMDISLPVGIGCGRLPGLHGSVSLPCQQTRVVALCQFDLKLLLVVALDHTLVPLLDILKILTVESRVQM